MIRSQKTELICLIAIALAVLISIALIGTAFALPKGDPVKNKDTIGIGTDYASKLFSTDRVHTIDIEISDLNWDYMVRHATDEQYVLCHAEIDGERIENIALRPKGNSSLAAMQRQGSEHFSFKIEFDHYRTGNTFYGLDKLCLNNLSADPTCMKDYFSYRLMQEAGAPGSLAAYTLLRINGEDFGLYLMVEGVEDSFAYRNYEAETGQFYKPEPYAINSIFSTISTASAEDMEQNAFLSAADAKPGERTELLALSLAEMMTGNREAVDVASIQYLGEDPSSYQVLFDTAVFRLTEQQKADYIAAVKMLNGTESPLAALDLDDVVRYFAAHNFVDNFDGYTGSAVHNFYLREHNGKLSLIPWDYNLAFGAFTIDGALESMFGDSTYAFTMDYGAGLTAEESAVNYPIDEPMQVATNEQRPMFGAWIDDPEAHAAYYAVYHRLLTDYFENGCFAEEYAQVYAAIRPYVAQGLTFYTVEHFDRGAENLRKFCLLRSESIRGQIDGTIPATKAGQMEHPETLMDVGDLNLGQTIEFSGLVMGVTSDDVLSILDAVCGEKEHSVDTLVATVQELMEDSSVLPAIVLRIWNNSNFVRRTVWNFVFPILLLILSVIAIWIGVACVKRPRRQ